MICPTSKIKGVLELFFWVCYLEFFVNLKYIEVLMHCENVTILDP